MENTKKPTEKQILTEASSLSESDLESVVGGASNLNLSKSNININIAAPTQTLQDMKGKSW